MNRHPRYSEDEVRGRLLHQRLLDEGLDEIDRYDWPETLSAPSIPRIVTTDTGTMRTIVTG